MHHARYHERIESFIYADTADSEAQDGTAIVATGTKRLDGSEYTDIDINVMLKSEDRYDAHTASYQAISSYVM